MQYDDRDLRKLQLLELRILKEIDRVCRELGITYFLDSGSVLGALRHGGFIPWDDDIDLGMPRADYDRFVAEAPALLGEEYVVSTPETNPHQAALFGKVWLRGTRFATEETIEAGFDQGIFVDLLPYDALSSDLGDGGKAASRLPLLAKRVVSFPCEEHRRAPQGSARRDRACGLRRSPSRGTWPLFPRKDRIALQQSCHLWK